MKKSILSFSLTFLFAFYAVVTRVGGARLEYVAPVVIPSTFASSSTTPTRTPVTMKPTPTPTKPVTSTPTPALSPTPTAVPVVTPTPTPAPTSVPTPTPVPDLTPITVVSKGKYKDGTYMGSVADAYYGNIQVQAVVANGALKDVQFLQYPSDRSTSVRINTRAMPQLTQQAISVQSANVDGVSGATDSSAAFRESLSVALAAALNN